jgi:hypothetical protein
MSAQYTTGTDQRTEAWSSEGTSGLCMCWSSDNTPDPYLENILLEFTPGIGCPRGFPWFSLATQDNSGILPRPRHITSFQIFPQSSSFSSSYITRHYSQESDRLVTKPTRLALFSMSSEHIGPTQQVTLSIFLGGKDE